LVSMFCDRGTNIERRHAGESRNQRSISGQNSYAGSSAKGAPVAPSQIVIARKTKRR
jgi:hypothetical protein